MVYNAMKLFMEINPQLFDDCSHEYAESQNNAEQKKKERQAKWDGILAAANQKRDKLAVKPPATTGTGQKVPSPIRFDNIDPMADGARRLEALRIKDEHTNITNSVRRPQEQGSVR